MTSSPPSRRKPAGVPVRPFGHTGVHVSALALGGWHLGLPKTMRESIRLAHAALDGGITFFDNAWDYHDGRSEELMGRAIAGRRDRVFLMTKLCTHGRDARVAMRQLEQSLRRLRTDHLDLWQIHECVFPNEPDLHFAPGGAVEALDRARQQGKVRFVGFTGHKDPAILLDMLSRGFHFDSCQLPLNCFDGSFRSFEQQVLPELRRQGVAAIGMKPFGGEGDMLRRKVVTAEEALRYAMSLPVATTVTGMESMRVLRQNLRIAPMPPYTADEMAALRARVARLAADGRFELYKTSARFDGNEARRQHGYPLQDEMTM